MKGIDILHVYSGTAGAAGTYLNSIYKSLDGYFSQECIVNYYFNFHYGKKVFYKYTELSGKNYFKTIPALRFYVRYLELFLSLTYVYFFVLFNKPKVINYSMTSNLYLEYFFLKLLKLSSRAKLMITCHDVLPNTKSYSSKARSLARRRLFFDLADKLLIHNENSKVDLKIEFNITDSKIVYHPFPVMDLTDFYPEVGSTLKSDLTSDEDKLKLLFIGHMRKEKGVDLLLEAWEKGNFSNVHLTIAGNVPPGSKYNFNELSCSRFTLVDEFLSDNDFAGLIRANDFVILPYTSGTNSGIPSSIISLGSIPIVSDIPMFINNKILCPELFFKSDSVQSICEKLNEISLLSESDIFNLKELINMRYNTYLSEFKASVISMYSDLI